jgi:O-antigen/teichoic acid export membrane protein
VRRLVLNTALNFAAFGATGLIGLALVPVLIGGLGLEGYGLVMLARTLFPSGLFGLFDLGLADAVTRHVAAARASGDAPRVGRTLGTALAAALAVAIPLALAVHAGAGWIAAAVFSVPAARAGAFADALRWTAWALPLLFVGAVVEGAWRGFERYAAIRAAEVAAAAAFAAGALALLARGAGLEAILALQVGVQAARAAALVALGAALALPGRRWRHLAASRGALDEIWGFARLGVARRVAGVGLVYGPPILLAHLAGPAAAGIYDAIMRLPRFAKVALGLANGALLPTATRIDAAEREAALAALLDHGTRLGLAALGPPLLVGAVLAEPILRLWLGPALAGWWPWLALAMLWAFVLHAGGTANGVAGARRELLAGVARFDYLELAIVIGLGLALASRLGPAAFLLSTALAPLAAFLAWLPRVNAAFGVRRNAHLASLAAVTIAFLPAGAILILLVAMRVIETPLALVAAAAAGCALGWGGVALLGLRDDDRRWARRALASLGGAGR